MEMELDMDREDEEDIIYINWTEFELSYPTHSEIDNVLSRPLDGHEPIIASTLQEEDVVVPVPVHIPEENEKLFLLQSTTIPLTYNTNLIFTFPIDNIPNFHFFFN